MTLELILIYVTCADSREAEVIGRALVSERLAACANILPELKAIYEWKGQLQQANECLLLLKARRTDFESCRRRIVELHSYTTPAIFAIPIQDVHEPYLHWLLAQTQASSPKA